MKRSPKELEEIQQQVGELRGEVTEIKEHVSTLTHTIRMLNDTIQEVIHTSRENLNQSRSKDFKHSRENMENLLQTGTFDLSKIEQHNSKDDLDNLSEDEPALISDTSPSEERKSGKVNSISFQYTEKFSTDKFSIKTGSFSHSSDEDLAKQREARSRRRFSLEKEMKFGVATAQNMQGSKMEDMYRVIPFQKSPPRDTDSSPKLEEHRPVVADLQQSKFKLEDVAEIEPPEKRRKIDLENAPRSLAKGNSIIFHEKKDGPSDGIPSYAFFAVYDGHGGPQAADYARSYLHANIVNHPSFKTNPEEAIRAGFAQTEKDFTDSIYTANRGIHGVGTTAVVALIYAQNHETTLYVAHVGDSEAVLCRKGKVIELTKPHNLKNPEERQRIEACNGRIVDERLAHPIWNPKLISLAVTRALGDLYYKHNDYTEGKPSGLIAEPEVTKVTLTTDDDFVLLASDGFWDVISKKAACDFVLSQPPDFEVNMTCKGLTDLALKERTLDDTTVLMIKLKSMNDDEQLSLTSSMSVISGFHPNQVVE